MTPAQLAELKARGDSVQELTTARRNPRSNRVFRIWSERSSVILKVYGTSGHERRERHALHALRGIPGTPVVLDEGVDEDMHWALFEDAGQWNLASLPENTGLAHQAGRLLRAIHSVDPVAFSNLPRGIDQAWVSVDFISTIRRLERYRGRLGISSDLIEAAGRVRPPFASPPRIAHTDPVPNHFLVDNAGTVTLVSWQWSTLAPPEWDLSRALWLIGLRAGPATAGALAAGYGVQLDAAQLDRWTVYHASMMLVAETEHRLSGRLDDLSFVVAELQRAVTAARGAA